MKKHLSLEEKDIEILVTARAKQSPTHLKIMSMLGFLLLLFGGFVALNAWMLAPADLTFTARIAAAKVPLVTMVFGIAMESVSYIMITRYQKRLREYIKQTLNNKNELPPWPVK